MMSIDIEFIKDVTAIYNHESGQTISIENIAVTLFS
jgi:hypothetical protein